MIRMLKSSLFGTLCVAIVLLAMAIVLSSIALVVVVGELYGPIWAVGSVFLGIFIDILAVQILGHILKNVIVWGVE